MSLEASIEKLAAVNEKLNATLERNNAILEAAVNKSTQAKTTAAPAESKPASTKPATKPATKAAGKKATGPTEEEVRTAFGAYLLKGPGGKKEEDARRQNLIAMNNHFGVGKMTEADPSIWPEAMIYLKQLADGETPDYMNEPGEEEVDESPV